MRMGWPSSSPCDEQLSLRLIVPYPHEWVEPSVIAGGSDSFRSKQDRKEKCD